jgi:DNA-binding transcriptional LysR family regulator
MNINYLRYFKEVCRHGSITKASEAVHVSQPSVTAAIKDLEKEFGIQLFFRTNSKIFLTPEGNKFLELTDSLLKEIDTFYLSSKELGESPSSTLRLGIPAVLGTFFFRKIVPGFQLANPGIRLDIIEVPTVTGIHMIDESSLDFLIGIEDEETKTFCDLELLFKTELYFAVSKDNPLSKEPIIEKQMIKEQPFVIISKGSYHYNAISKHFCTAGTPLNVVLQSNQVSTIRYMLENDYAATIIYKEVFAGNDNIKCIPLADPIDANIGIFWRKNSYITSAMKTFISYLKQLH